MARRRHEIRLRAGRVAGPALRMCAGALMLAAAACCPAPVAPAADTPTAFAAVVAAVHATSWIAETPGGARVRVDGDAPAAVGARVYVAGAIAPDGSLTLDRADPLAIE